jgi:signal transduction histidine kinase
MSPSEGAPLPTLLIVDDQAANIQVMSSILAGAYTVLFAKSGKKALEIVSSRQVDLIILDVMMPSLDGYEVCRLLKDNEETLEIPVIFVTAKVDDHDEARGFAAGGVDYITKPVSPSILKARVATHLLLKETSDRYKEAAEEMAAAQDRLIAHEKMASIGQLVGGIVHEIKNPLNFVTNFSEGTVDLASELTQELIKHRAKLSEEDYLHLSELVADIVQNAEDIRENGRRADSIIQSMMLHARGGDGERQPVEINPMAEKNLNLAYHGFRALDPSFNVTIKRNYDDEVGVLQIVEQDLGRVILNLLNNACYAVRDKQRTTEAPYSPTLWVSTHKTEESIEIRIRDNGLGIPEEIREQIFDPFFTTKPSGEANTGLGLSISHDIVVEGHQGKLEVTSEPGEFTEFVIRLPLAG